jgi:hypothetical protein
VGRGGCGPGRRRNFGRGCGQALRRGRFGKGRRGRGPPGEIGKRIGRGLTRAAGFGDRIGLGLFGRRLGREGGRQPGRDRGLAALQAVDEVIEETGHVAIISR